MSLKSNLLTIRYYVFGGDEYRSMAEIDHLTGKGRDIYTGRPVQLRWDPKKMWVELAT